MPSPEPLRIFLSYGHDEYSSLAVRVERDLEALGHEVWFDTARLKPGGDWERYIEDGLDFASAVPDDGRFLLLMTPHSVRRPNGYCLNELARAFGRNLPVIPVMVSQVEPPLSIGRLQYLDMRQCFPAEQHEKQYKKQFQQLLNALTQKQVPFEGVQQRLLNYLAPISYGDDLSRHLERFTGREWVMAEAEEWLATSRRVLWITGDAGVGKSALAAWLCDKRPEIVAYHFCRFGNSDRVDPRKALFSLAYQLSTQLPDYRDRLNASPLDKTALETNVPAIFDRLFVDLLNDLSPTRTPQVVLIDALDEASRNGKNELASLIGTGFDRLPPWLRLIATSRPQEQEINFDLQALDPWMLDAGRPENLEDIRKYLQRELQPFTGNGAPSEQVISTIVDRSEGLFLYVNWVRQELQNGRLSLQQVEFFPRGLGGVYKDFFERYFPDIAKYKSDSRPALEAICAAREPLERDDFRAMFGWSEYEMDSLAGQLGSLFPVRDGRVRPFHQSVRDWLTNRQLSGPYRVDLRAGEQRLADFGWQQYKRGVGAMRRYCITHAPSHFAVCLRKAELNHLLLDPDWMAAKLKTDGVVSLLGDFDLALNLLSPHGHEAAERKITDDREIEALQLVQGAVRLSSNALANDPGQFASQIVGRLVRYQGIDAIVSFAERVAAGEQNEQKPWLRSLHPGLHPPKTGLLRTLSGHSENVQAVAVTSDGQRAVSASDDNTLKVWELSSGLELLTLSSHSFYVRAVAVTPDGQRAISASWDNTMKVWDLSGGRELFTFSGHRGYVRAVAVTPDGRRVLSASGDNTLKIWDLGSGKELRTLSGHTDDVNAVAITPDGRRAVSASEDKTLKVWDLANGRKLRTLSGHKEEVNSVAVTSDGKLAVSASDDKTLKIWDLGSGKELCTLSGHTGNVNAVAVTPDGRRAVSASDDKALKVWDLEHGRELRTLPGHTRYVNAVAVTPDGQLAVSASWDKTLKVWELSRGCEPAQADTPSGHTDIVNAVAVTPDGHLAVSGSADTMLKVWDLASGRELRTLSGHSFAVAAVAVTPDGRWALSASWDDTVKLWELSSGRKLRTLSGHSDKVTGIAVAPDGRRAVSASHDGTLKVWDLASGRELRTLEGHTIPIKAVALTPDGRRAVSTTYDGTRKVWELRRGYELRTLSGNGYPVNALAVTPDGRRAVSACYDNTLKVWELRSGRELLTLSGHAGEVAGVAVSADGQLAVSASWDKTLKVWELDSGKCLATFTCDSAVYCCAYSDALKLIVAGDGGGRLHFLRLEEAKLIP